MGFQTVEHAGHHINPVLVARTASTYCNLQQCTASEQEVRRLAELARECFLDLVYAARDAPLPPTGAHVQRVGLVFGRFWHGAHQPGF